MRLRNIRGAKERIEESRLTIQTPEQQRGHWQEVFSENQPLHIEIGMGKGRFIKTLAEQNPDINYIGIEKYESVLIRAIEKTEEEEISNLCFICMNADKIEEVFDPGEVDRIYLNFSDPWPKERHARRRLTSRLFLDRYDRVLKAEGRLIFKTDNRALFDFSVAEIRKAGWQLDSLTFDLHHSEYMEGNVMTEYEEKFSREGVPIHQLVARR